MSSVQLFLREFPRLLVGSTEERPIIFHGYINLAGRDREIYLKSPNFPNSDDSVLTFDTETSVMLQPFTKQLKQFEAESKYLLDLLRKLKDLCDNGLGSIMSSSRSTNNFEYDQDLLVCLLQHLGHIGWKKISAVADDLSTVTLTSKDAAGRCHELEMTFPPDYPESCCTLKHQLPCDLKVNWCKKLGLQIVVEAWEKLIVNLQEFWAIMDEVDNEAVILDPPAPTTKHTTRRLLLENHVCVQLTISWQWPQLQPQHICLIGASSVTNPLNARMAENYDLWDGDMNLIVNLERLLGVKVVKKQQQQQQQQQDNIYNNNNNEGGWAESVECAVCYDLQQEDGSLPDISCDHCKRNFHHNCLYEWLRSLPSSHQSMQFIRGECPYCSKAISCQVPSSLWQPEQE